MLCGDQGSRLAHQPKSAHMSSLGRMSKNSTVSYVTRLNVWMDVAMEIDEAPSASASGDSQRPPAEARYTIAAIHLVVDTNFILSHLSIVDELASRWDYYQRVYTITIPTQVVQELDGLKETGSTALAASARAAIDWCYTHFHNLSPQVRGQRMAERLDPHAAKDDSILDCCLFLAQETARRPMVVLLSNDKNLCNKALINGILTVSYRRGMAADVIAERIVQELHAGLQAGTGAPVQGGSASGPASMLISPEPVDHMLVEETPLQAPLPKETLDLTHACAEIYNQALVLVKEALTFAVNHIFAHEAHLSGYDANKIHTLVDAGYCIHHMYISTFSDFFTRTAFNPQRYLSSRGQARVLGTKPLTLAELQQFVDFWAGFLAGIYKERTREQQKALRAIVDGWKTMIDMV